MSYFSKMKEMVSGYEGFSELLPVVAYDDATGIFIMDDGYIGISFLCTPVTGTSDNMDSQLEPLFTSDYPEDSLIQVMLYGSPDIKKYTNEYLAMRGIKATESERRDEQEIREAMGLQTASGLENFIINRAKFVEEKTTSPLSEESGLKVRDMKSIISIKSPIKSKNGKPSQSDLAKMSSLKNQVSQILKQVGMKPHLMNGHDWIHTMNTIINWNDDATWKTSDVDPSDNDPLRNQVMDWGNKLEVEMDNLKLGNKYVGMASIRKWPQMMSIDRMYALVGDFMTGTRGVRDNFMIVLNVHVPSASKAIGKMAMKRQKVNYQAFGPMLKWVPRLASQKYSFDFLFDKLDDGGKPLRAYLQFIVFSENKTELEKSLSSMRSLYQEQKFLILQEKYMCLPLFIQSLPLCSNLKIAKQFNRYKTFSSQHVVHLLPIISDWKGTHTPIMNFFSRNGQLMNMDLFDSLTNYNACVAAKSGAGKSVFANFLINNYLSIEGNRVWMIDVGRSYEKLANEIGGEFIVFDKTSNFSLNPFRLVENYEDEEEKNTHRSMIHSIICAMASDEGNLTEFESKVLSKIMNEMWDKHGADLTVTVLAEECERSEDRRVRDLSVKLYPFTEKGPHGSFFTNDKPSLQFTKEFVVLELEEIKDREDLQTVVLLTLISTIQHAMYLGDRDHNKLVCIDEAWSLIAKGSVASFVESGYRRFRKYNGSAITITQSINDLYNTPSGAAIAENSSIFFLLAQKSESVDQLKSTGRLSFSDGMFEFIKSVHTVPGVYSEVFFYTELGTGIGRLYIDRYSQLLYSTNPRDITAIKRFKGPDDTTLSAIQKLIDAEEKNKTDKDNKETKDSIFDLM